MELELKTTQLNCYDTVLDTTLFQEETLESIVPDACPDILRIVDTEAAVCLGTKEAQEGRAEVTGTARCAVLYEAEGGGGVRRITVSIPFTCTAEAAGLTRLSRLSAEPRVMWADARSLNPRKVLVRVSLAVAIQAYAPQTASFCDGVEDREQSGIQTLEEVQTACFIVAVEEKSFTFSDDLSLSATRPAAAELLKRRVELMCGESKLIGNKLIFKGEAGLHLVYRESGGSLCGADFTLPFSQIMEVSGAGEEADCTLSVVLTGIDCTLDGDEGRTMSVALGMMAQAVVREERQVTLLTDLYSTAYDLTVQRRSHALARLLEHGERRLTARELLETASPVREVCDVHIHVGQVEVEQEGDQGRLKAELSATVLYLSEEGGLESVTRTVSAACPVELPSGAMCRCRCLSSGEGAAAPVGGGVELRCPLEFRYLSLMPRQTAGVAQVRLEEDAPRDPAARPSIVLRAVEEGERLWDIAKAYGTTMEDIVQANGLGEEAPTAGQVLLIPKKR